MTFFSLLSPQGKGKEALDYLKKMKAPRGIVIHNIYVTLGRYDAAIVFEAPSIESATRFAMQVGLGTGYTTETLAATPIIDISSWRLK